MLPVFNLSDGQEKLRGVLFLADKKGHPWEKSKKLRMSMFRIYGFTAKSVSRKTLP